MHPNHPLSDADLEALLRTLPREAPSTGFADRVMARVQLPAAVSAGVPVRRRVPWRALAGLAALDLAVAIGLLAWFGDDLLRFAIDGVHGLAKGAATLSAVDLGAMWEVLVTGVLSAGVSIPSVATLSTLFILSATGACIAILTLGRLTRGGALPSR